MTADEHVPEPEPAKETDRAQAYDTRTEMRARRCQVHNKGMEPLAILGGNGDPLRAGYYCGDCVAVKVGPA
jgi:hypothetical protein